MSYDIRCDGNSIYSADDSLALLNPKLDLEENEPGSLIFTMVPTHTYYDMVKPFTSDIEVYEDSILIFFGRVIDTTIDFMNRKKVTCEGALGYFNDTIQMPKVFELPDADPETPDPEYTTTVHEFFAYLIAEHNKFVTSANRTFKIGNVDITDKYISRELDYDKTLDALKKMCLDAEGGYFYFRKEQDGNYIDWLTNRQGVSSQPIQYSINLTDLTNDFKGSEMVTSIIPIGEDDLNLQYQADPENPDPDVNIRNPGMIYVDSDAVESYGRIIEKVDFDGITDKQQLYNKAIQWLEDKQFEATSINVDSADLSYFNPDYGRFRLGQLVHVVSTPHLIDKDFPIVKISYSLDSPVKNITIGTVPRKSLTEIYASGGGGGAGKDAVTKRQAKKISTNISTDITNTAIENIDYVQEIQDNLNLKIDETDHTIHTYYGDNPERHASMLLDSTGVDILEALDDISDKLLEIYDYTEPEEEDPEEP